VIGYAGVLGHAQGLEIIIEAAKKLKTDEVCFLVAGSGPMEKTLKMLIQQEDLKNVKLVGALSKAQMPNFLSSIDAALVPLKKSDLFLGAIPSKIFENAAYKKPLLLGVDGEAKELFIDQGKAGLYFEPENATDLVKGIKTLLLEPEMCAQLGQNGREYVKNNFLRENITSQLEGYFQTLFREKPTS